MVGTARGRAFAHPTHLPTRLAASLTSHAISREGVYVVTWREILIDLAAAFVYDMRACRSTGCAWGTPGGLREPRHILTGAFFEKLNEAGYPADIELV